MLQIASFAIGLITLLVAIAAFALPDPNRNQGARYGLVGFFCLCLTGVFMLIGIFATIGESSSETPTSAPPSNEAAGFISTELDRCDWLLTNFPQSREGIASRFNFLSVERIRMIYEGCGQTANGFVVEFGPQVSMVVPAGGCIDAPQDAGFSDATVPDGVGGLRAYSGTVQAIAMTYRPWCE